MTTEVKQLDTAQRAHHPDSPSSLTASEACPCFENEQRESKAADDGTLQHKAAETRDLDILHGDEAMVAAVQKCIAYEDRVLGYFREVLQTEPIVTREKYLPVGDDVVTDANKVKWIGVTGGFPDILIYSLSAGEAHIIDYKFGKVPVTPTKDNLQGMAYALASMQELGSRIKRVVVHFYAPYQGWSEQEQEEKYIHVFTREDMPQMELRIRTVIARKKSPNAKPCPKTDLCIWCAKKGSCPALWSVVAPLGGKYEDMVTPDVIPPHQLSLPSQVASAVKFAGQVVLWAEAVKARATTLVKEGELDVPGYTLVKASKRKVVSVAAMKKAALKAGMTEDSFLETLKPSFEPVEKFIKASSPKGKGAGNVRQFNSDCDEFGATVMGDPYYFLKEVKSPADEQNNKAIEV